MDEGFVFTPEMMSEALEANGWFNAWDIYWTRGKEYGADWGGLIVRDAFEILLREKKLLPMTTAPRDAVTDAGKRAFQT
ncbi:hypothetical protein ACNHKD_07265 [Methylocystis sp. JAN1]|uniref:hypothetical protein n=1 Tax=Methylocystis sp. JAN1 TaxID=3397211 RepID=UPI003FA2EC1D